MRNFAAKSASPEAPDAGPGASTLDYYEMYDLVALQFASVRMVGRVPFVGVALAELGDADGEPAVSVETQLVEESDARKYVELFPDEFRLNSDSNDAQAAKADPGSHAAAIARVQQEEAGLRPAVLRQHDVPILGPVLVRAYRRIPWFRGRVRLP